MTFLPKQHKCVYEKNLTSKHLLQNLKSYKLANRDINPSQSASLREKYGDDEGKVYGALIAGGEEGIKSPSDQRQRQRKRQRGKSRLKQEEKREEDTRPVKVIKSKEKEKEDTPLTSLVAYSSDSDEEEIAQSNSPMKYEIPSVIRELYCDDSATTNNKSDQCNTLDSDSDPETLGYFQHNESDSEPENLHISSETTSNLSTYKCWKCGKPGHLSENCLVNKKKSISIELQKLYAQCRDIRSRKGDSCISCGVHSNLAFCLDCGSILCDGRGHLVRHLLEHPTHKQLYSYKLGRMIKCNKPDCDVTDVYELLTCSQCLSKVFSQHYSMITATWSRSGLRAIPNAMCCEDHFQWHRMNCSNPAEECLVSSKKLKQNCLSEFFF